MTVDEAWKLINDILDEITIKRKANRQVDKAVELVGKVLSGVEGLKKQPDHLPEATKKVDVPPSQ